MCLECSFEKRCGEETQNDKCNFIKISEIKKLIDEETAKIKGTACISPFYFMQCI